MNEYLEKIVTDIRDNKVTRNTVYEALALPDEIWENYQTIRIIGGANLNYLESVTDYAREYAQQEFPEIFSMENNNDEN